MPITASLDDSSKQELAAAPFEVIIEPSCSGGNCSTSTPLKYRPLQPDLFGRAFKAEWLTATFRAAVEDGSTKALRAVLHEEVPGRVFSFEMLEPEFCAALLAETQNYEASGLPVTRPNSMNNYGVILNQIGMKGLLDDLQRWVVQPLAASLFPVEGSEFTAHHSFMVQVRDDRRYLRGWNCVSAHELECSIEAPTA